MTFSRVSSLLVVLALGLALSHPSQAKGEKVYTWKDEQGVVHYGEHPPKDTQAKLIHTRTGHSEPTPIATPASTTAASNNQAAAAQPAPEYVKDPQRCAAAKANLALLNSVARIKTKNAEGVSVYLTEEDKTKQREAMQLAIKQSCD